jgi:hypothetical protein
MPRRQASPEERYASLVARFAGEEWIVLDASHSDADWLERAREAQVFVS